MIVEFQMALEQLISQLRDRLMARSVCARESIAIKSDGAVVTCVLDRVQLEETLLGEVRLDDGSSTRTLEISQRIRLFLVPLDGLSSNGVKASVPFAEPSITVYFTAAVRVGAENPALCVAYSRIDLGLAEGLVNDETRAKLEARLQGLGSCTILDLSPITTLTKKKFAVATAGLALFPKNKRKGVCVRLESIEPGVPAADWSKFDAGDIDDRLGTGDWSLLIDSRLLSPAVRDIYKTELAKPATAKTFALDSEVSASWESWWGSSMAPEPLPSLHCMRVRFHGQVVKACKLINTDIGADIWVSIAFTVTKPNVLQMYARLGWDVDDDDVVLCGLEWGLLGGVVGAVVGGPIGLGAVGLVAGLVGGFFTVIFIASTRKPDTLPFPKKGEFICKEVGDEKKDIICEMSVPLGKETLLEGITLTSADGIADGLLLSGTADGKPTWPNPSPSVWAHPVLDVWVNDFSWQWSDACSTASLEAISDVHFRNAGSAPLHFCEVLVINDPLGNFDLSNVPAAGEMLLPGHSTQVTIRDRMAGYPCKLRIRTTGGARLLTIAAAIDLSEERKATLGLELEAIRQGVCIQPIVDVWGIDRKHHPKWGGGDPPFPADSGHLWEVVLTGLGPTDTVSLRTTQGRSLATAPPTGMGTAHLTALISPPEPTGYDLSIVRDSRASEGTQNGEERRVLIAQKLLVPQSFVALHEACSQLGARYFEGSPALFTTAPSGLSVYSLATPAFPNLVLQVQLMGIRGALPWDDEFLAWGPIGMILIERNGALREQSPRTQAMPILDLLQIGDHLYALREADIGIYDRQLQEVATLSQEGGRHLAAGGETLAVSTAQGVELFDLSQPLAPARLGAYEAASVVGLVRPQMLNSQRSTFLRSNEGGGPVLELSNDFEPREVMRFEEDPWFVGAARVGRIIGCLDGSSTLITVYTLRSASRKRTPIGPQ
jgi:hypothetical protein